MCPAHPIPNPIPLCCLSSLQPVPTREPSGWQSKWSSSAHLSPPRFSFGVVAMRIFQNEPSTTRSLPGSWDIREGDKFCLCELLGASCHLSLWRKGNILRHCPGELWQSIPREAPGFWILPGVLWATSSGSNASSKAMPSPQTQTSSASQTAKQCNLNFKCPITLSLGVVFPWFPQTEMRSMAGTAPFPLTLPCMFNIIIIPFILFFSFLLNKLSAQHGPKHYLRCCCANLNF